MDRPSGIAFLLSQLGAHVATQLAMKLEELDVTPAHLGVLRVVGQHPGSSQRALCEQLDALPSRMVRLLDELEDRGLIERRRSATDRRNHEIHIADSGRPTVASVMSVVAAHDADIRRALTQDQQQQLRELLTIIAGDQGLAATLHPGLTRPRTTG